LKRGSLLDLNYIVIFTDEGILKKVASGVDSNQLNYADFEAMANSNSVTTNKIKMSVNWDSLEVKTFNQDIILKMIPADII
jgi:hypothetical protein